MTPTTPLRLAAVLGAFIASVVCTAAHAGPVPYRGNAPVQPASPLDRPDLDGVVVADQSVPFTLIDTRFNAEYDLVLHNSVVREHAAGTLDFYYRVTNASDLPVRLLDVDTGSFARWGSFDPVEALYRDDVPGRVGPLRADRELSQFDGVVLTFPFFDTLSPGESSRLFVLRTEATRFELAGLTQFRSTPGYTDGNGFALTYNPVLDGPLVPPPAAPGAVPAPPAVWMALVAVGAAGAAKAIRRITAPRH
jgi:hypothetical protein